MNKLSLSSKQNKSF